MFLIGSNTRRLFRVQMPPGRADFVHGRCMGALLDCHGGPDKKKCVANGFRGNFRCSGKIERTRAAGTRAFDEVEVDHGGGDVGMAEEILDGSDVGAVLEEAGCKRVTERVACGAFGDIGFADGVFELALHGGLVEVMAGDPTGVGMGAEGCGREDIYTACTAWRNCQS